MKKSELKTGDVVQYPDGEYRMYLQGMGFFNPANIGFASEYFLDEDLRLDGAKVKTVYRPKDAYDVNAFLRDGKKAINKFTLVYPVHPRWMENPEEKLAEGMLFIINDPDEEFEKMVLMQIDIGKFKLFSPGSCNRVSDKVFTIEDTLEDFDKSMLEMGYEITGMKRNARIVFVVE